jgi:hypothetical protein
MTLCSGCIGRKFCYWKWMIINCIIPPCRRGTCFFRFHLHTLLKITPDTGKERGDIEVKDYVVLSGDRTTILFLTNWSWTLQWHMIGSSDTVNHKCDYTGWSHLNLIGQLTHTLGSPRPNSVFYLYVHREISPKRTSSTRQFQKVFWKT